MAFQVTIEYDVEFLVMTELFHKYKHYIFEINLLRPRSVSLSTPHGAQLEMHVLTSIFRFRIRFYI